MGIRGKVKQMWCWYCCPNAVALPHSPRKVHAHSKFGGKAHLASSCYISLLTLFACFTTLHFLLRNHPPAPESHGCGERLPSITTSSPSTSSTRAVTHPPVASHRVKTSNVSSFWAQPDGAGFVPCTDFSRAFQAESARVLAQRDRYLVVVVNGGLNQQRIQIVDAVVMARVLGAALVLPIMQVNPIWEDESEFSDIFDVEHFKEALKDEVRIVSTLPSTHVMFRAIEEKHTPLYASPRWLRQHYNGKISREGVLLLRGLDSRLSRDLPPDLQKLRCKVAFHGLRFAKPIQELGVKLAERMRSQGPYLALHLRLEIDVWVRTGCLPGLGPDLDAKIRSERKVHPNLLTSRGAKLGFTARKLAGLCPLTGSEVARLLVALGAAKGTRVYWAGGEPFGKERALGPLREAFPALYNKESLATAEELQPFRRKASSLAALDYLVSLDSDVFLQSHGGNFGRVMQGHRAYLGHRKHIVPNKRQMIPHFLNSTLTPTEFGERIRALHEDRVGKPSSDIVTSGVMDVLAHPVPGCMCQRQLSSQ